MEEPHTVVDVRASPLLELMQRKIDRAKTNEAQNFTIFRIPHNISQSRKNPFEPSVISIGPFHRGKKSLKAMEEHKWRLLESCLSRSRRGAILDLCISEMELLEVKTRTCYSETFDDLDSHAFVEMMLLDGCFLLEYLLKTIEGNWNSILEVGWHSYFINCDLLLLENQIPFFIVQKLCELIGFKQDTRMIFAKCVVLSLVPKHYILPAPPAETPDTTDSIIADLPFEIPNPPAEIPNPLAEIIDPPAEIHHLVHLWYHYVVPNPEKPVVLSSKSFVIITMFHANRIIKGLIHWFHSSVLRRRSPHSTSRSSSEPLPNSTGNLSSMVIPSATELKQKGVKLALKSNPIHMLDISFEYGILKIPRLEISDDTVAFFANLMAFEHTKYGKKDKPFTRFVAFLDNLVNTPNDVTILQECGIIENWLGSEEELANFINRVTEGNIWGRDHYLAELYTEVNGYSESRWNRQRAKLIRDYFNSPWATISVVGAFILLVLTFVQSFFAVFSYIHPPST